MEAKINTKLLKEALQVAETTLQDLEDDKSINANRKRKRINKALEKAYATLNLGDYTQHEIDKRTDEVWKSLLDDDNYLALLIFFFGILLSGTIVFTVFQAYSFIQYNLDQDRKNSQVTEELSSLVNVNYKEERIISLYDQMTVKDSVGLNNPPEEFTISNDSSLVNGLDYLVNYYIYLVPLNDPTSHLIDKKYIKYRYSYKDSVTGKYFESEIGTLADLPVREDGTLLLTKGTQNKDSKTDFKVTFWLGLGAPNEEQGATYTFKFKVDADIAQAR